MAGTPRSGERGYRTQERADSLTGVNFLSHFCYPSGLQQAALGYTASLEAVGLRTSCRDVPAGVETQLAPRDPWLGFEDYPVTITNVAPTPHFADRYRRAGLAQRTGVISIAYWAWELETIPDEWSQLASDVDEIWTPTPFVSAAMRAKMRVPVYDMLPGVSIGEVETIPRAQLELGEDEFVFLFMFDMRSDFERKNPLAVVRAFREAFSASDGATLVIKLSRGSSDEPNLQRLREAAAGAKVVLIDEVVSRAQAYGYIAMADCVVSLHRSEGFGLLMAEAMLLGKPVIATNYSGNTAFMDAENSLLVDYSMVEVAADGPIYKRGSRWAEASPQNAALCMRRLFEDRAEAAALGKRGQRSATETLALRTAGERMKARLAELWRERRG
jgi:glycosyltransferase involved in cell wall biosynthesis